MNLDRAAWEQAGTTPLAARSPPSASPAAAARRPSPVSRRQVRVNQRSRSEPFGVASPDVSVTAKQVAIPTRRRTPTMPPLELSLEVVPHARIDVTDVRARAAAEHGNVLDRFAHCLYYSFHTTAGYLPQSLATRLSAAQPAGRPAVRRPVPHAVPRRRRLQARRPRSACRADARTAAHRAGQRRLAPGVHRQRPRCLRVVPESPRGAGLFHRPRWHLRGHAAPPQDDPHRLQPRDRDRDDADRGAGVVAPDRRHQPEGPAARASTTSCPRSSPRTTYRRAVSRCSSRPASSART